MKTLDYIRQRIEADYYDLPEIQEQTVEAIIKEAEFSEERS